MHCWWTFSETQIPAPNDSDTDLQIHIKSHIDSRHCHRPKQAAFPCITMSVTNETETQQRTIPTTNEQQTKKIHSKAQPFVNRKRQMLPSTRFSFDGSYSIHVWCNQRAFNSVSKCFLLLFFFTPSFYFFCTNTSNLVFVCVCDLGLFLIGIRNIQFVR